MPDRPQTRLADQRVHEWFLREQARKERENEAQPDPSRPLMRVLTISREYSAGGHTVAGLVAKQLGPEWEIWDKEIIEEVARSAKVRAEMVESMDERTQTWVEQVLRTVFGVKTMETLQYRHHLAQVLLVLAQQGNKIIVGRGANFVLEHALNVRLWATEAYRIETTIKRENLSREEARQRVHQRDKERSDFTRSVFDRDINDPKAYDMVLRVDEIGDTTCAAAIVAVVRERFGKA